MRKIINFVLLLTCANSALAQARQEVRRDFRKTVTLTSGKLFRIEGSLGSIRIHSHAQPQAAVVATIKCGADTTTEAESLCSEIQISMQENSAGLTVVTDYPKSIKGSERRNVGYSVEYDITLPDTTSLDVRN